LVNSEDFPEKITLMSSSYSVSYYTSSTAKPEEPWHSAKEYISNKLFKSLEELESLINKLLNEGGLTIRWGRKNKGSSTIAS
jgi:hypothetical protein